MCMSTNCPWICTIMYYIWLTWLRWQPCATMYMVNFVNTLQQIEEKGHNLSHFYNIDNRYTHLLCMCKSITPPFTTVILPNIHTLITWKKKLSKCKFMWKIKQVDLCILPCINNTNKQILISYIFTFMLTLKPIGYFYHYSLLSWLLITDLKKNCIYVYVY